MRTPSTIAAFLLILLFMPAGASSKEKKQGPEALKVLDQVRALTDIRTEGSQPFRLTAHVQADAGKSRLTGDLVLTWMSPLQWREEVNFPGFNQARVASGGKLWTARNLKFEPAQVYHVIQLLDLGEQWRPQPEESAVGVKDRKQDGSRVRCAELSGPGNRGRELCVDSASGLPAEFSQRTFEGDPSALSYEYRDYVSWNGKSFPGSIRAYEGKRPMLDIRAAVGPAPPSDTSLFAPPPQASEWDWCDHASPPKELSKAVPVYPDSAKHERRSGVVSVYFVIATDGSIRQTSLVRSAGPDLDAATLATVNKWRYQPAMCGNKPITTETVEDTTFSLVE